MNLKVISRNVGVALLVSSLFMLLAVVVSLIDGGDSALAPLLLSFTITFIVGVFPFIFTRKNANISLKDGFMIIFLSWLLSFIFGALPYALWGGPFTVINAWFESVSGFTTTGATILEDVEALPRSLLFWRASTHFIGGLGVVIFLLLIIPNTSPIRLRLTNMELSSLSRDDYRTRANKSVYIFASVFLGLAGAAFVTYMLVGMDWFDAICHAFTVCATGGFSTRNLSIASFGSPLISIVTIVFMFLGSVHFGIIFMALVGRSLRPLNNPILKFYTLSLAVIATITSLSLKLQGPAMSWGQAFLD
ncbi:MAG: TrkH family potassium uptake protein, partial [Bacteroidales bacterium]|nr:TrkH family potassium uptake protein [Bacteroidales bacterium]